MGGGRYQYYPCLLPRRKVTENDLMRHLENEYHVKRSDYKKVIIALQEIILYFLDQSNHIELGYVSLHIKGSGEDEPEKVGLHNIKSSGLHFRFSQLLKDGLKGLTFEKAGKRELAKEGRKGA